MHHRIPLLLALSTLGCRANVPVPAPVDAPPGPDVSAIPVASAAPVVGAASVAGVPPVGDESEGTRARLTLTRELPCAAEVFVLEGRSFVACDDAIFSVDERGELVAEPKLTAGLALAQSGDPFGRRIQAIAGRYPESAWALTVEVLDAEVAGNSTRHRFFRWEKERWVASGPTLDRGGAEELVAFPWTKEGLAVVASQAWKATRAVGVVGKRTVPLPAFTKAEQTKDERANYACVTALLAPEAWVSLGPGDVLLFSGALCGVPKVGVGSTLGFERLRAGETRSALSLIPVPDDAPPIANWRVLGAAALSSTHVWLAALGTGERSGPDERSRTYGLFATWDGENWTSEEPPFSSVTGVWSAGGALFVADETGALWRRVERNWSPVLWRKAPGLDAPKPNLRDDDRCTQLVAPAEGTLWLVRQKSHQGETKSWVYSAVFE